VTSSRIDWNTIPRLGSLHEFRAFYAAQYEEFLAAATFERKCRLVLDLYKLQFLFVGILSNWR
jgi:hypothetical protein